MAIVIDKFNLRYIVSYKSSLCFLVLIGQLFTVRGWTHSSLSLDNRNSGYNTTSANSSLELALSENSLVNNPETKKVRNGFANTPKAPAFIDISVISSEMANKLFEMIKEDKSFSFTYLIEGCQANAHKMSLVAETYNIHFGKIYAEGRLQVKTNHPLKPYIAWGWHVAPFVFVRTEGHDELKVFDPSIFDGPVSIEAWTQKMMYNKNGYEPKI